MGYFDIIKKSIYVTNRNLLAILVQILYIIALMIVLGVIALIFIAMFAGSLAGLSQASLNPENLVNILKSSIGMIFIAAVLGLLFFIIAALLAAVTQSGILGCLVQTARGETGGFDTSVFFSSVRSSAMPLFWLRILVLLIGLGVILVLVLVGVAGFGLVLIPLKEAGNQLAAFAIGVPLLVVLILAALAFFFLFYSGSMLSMVSLVAGSRGAVSALGDAYDFIKARFWDVMLFTLLVVFLLFAASMVIELVTLPFRFASGDKITGVFLLLPVMLVASVLKMYLGIIAVACFVVYYVNATEPPVPEPLVPLDDWAGPGPADEGQGEDILDAEIISPDDTHGDTPSAP